MQAPTRFFRMGAASTGPAAPDARKRVVTEFRWPVRVYYEDTDAGGVVYHAGYLRFMERARTEWMRSRGFDQSVLRERHGVLFVVRRMEVDFLSPARLDDTLSVSARLERLRPARILLRQEISRAGAAAGEALCGARVEVACLDAATRRPRRIPAAVTAALADER